MKDIMVTGGRGYEIGIKVLSIVNILYMSSSEIALSKTRK